MVWRGSVSGAIACAVATLVCMPLWSQPVVQAPPSMPIVWEQLPPIPDREGFATPFAGVSGGALIVAGGANFPDRRPWQGGTKVWYDSCFVLPAPNAAWQPGPKLPRPVAYGVSITTPAGLVCIGGGDATRHFTDVRRYRWSDGRLESSPLPSLPKPRAFMAGALVGETIFVAGGIETPDATRAAHTCWSLDLARLDAAWQEVPSWPGPERNLPVAGACDGSFFLFSGTRLEPGPDGKPLREFLRDAYRYTPGRGWQRLADMPRAAAAAPSPAPLWGQSRLLVICGDDGVNIHFKPEERHPGFPRDVLAYDVTTDNWQTVGEIPFSLVTTNVVMWGDRIVIPGGERIPGFRSQQVWSARATIPDAR